MVENARARGAAPAGRNSAAISLTGATLLGLVVLLAALLIFQAYAFVALPNPSDTQGETLRWARVLTLGTLGAILGGTATVKVTSKAGPVNAGVYLAGTVAAFGGMTLIGHLLVPAAGATTQELPGAPPATRSGACEFQALPAFATMRQADRTADPGWRLMDLGCATAAPGEFKAAFEMFEKGSMFWLGPWAPVNPNQQGGTTYAIMGTEEGYWRSGRDDYREGESLTKIEVPSWSPNLKVPDRGIGKVWRNIGGVSSGFGFALDAESGHSWRNPSRSNTARWSSSNSTRRRACCAVSASN